MMPDIVAGATTAAVVIPQAMAYATIAGLPVEYGLYCALVPMVVYAALGTSRPLSVSTTSTISILTASAIATSDEDPVVTATTLAFVVGVVLLVSGVVRLGFLADLISDSVLAGFKVGMGLVIISDQWGRLLGVDVTGDDFFEKTWDAIEQISDASIETVVLGSVSVAVLLSISRFAPRVPGPLIVVVGREHRGSGIDGSRERRCCFDSAGSDRASRIRGAGDESCRVADPGGARDRADGFHGVDFGGEGVPGECGPSGQW
jgi:SulP family sulfate permease